VNGKKNDIHTFGESLRQMGFTGVISYDVPLAPLTWYYIGGPAQILIEPDSPSDLVIAKSALNKNPVPVLVIGAGSNLLIADEGFPGAVIHLAGDFGEYTFDIERHTITSGAAASLPKIVREGARAGLKGIERLAGIPGSVGGAIFMNAGTHGEYIENLVSAAQVLTESNEMVNLTSEECRFSYRASRFQETGEIIIGCELTGAKGNAEEITAEVERRLERRRESQPVDVPSCGCVFRNPEGDKSAGKLIDEAGLKGTKIGDAVISEKHANFIINRGSASAKDVLALMALVRRLIHERTGIYLKPEVRIAGFPEPIEVMLDAWPEN
jgi:UDP-N-acetylmuramate dehydrogenase